MSEAQDYWYRPVPGLPTMKDLTDEEVVQFVKRILITKDTYEWGFLSQQALVAKEKITQETITANEFDEKDVEKYVNTLLLTKDDLTWGWLCQLALGHKQKMFLMSGTVTGLTCERIGV